MLASLETGCLDLMDRLTDIDVTCTIIKEFNIPMDDPEQMYDVLQGGFQSPEFCDLVLTLLQALETSSPSQMVLDDEASDYAAMDCQDPESMSTLVDEYFKANDLDSVTFGSDSQAQDIEFWNSTFVIDQLISQLQCQRMLATRTTSSSSTAAIEMDENTSKSTRDLIAICDILGVPSKNGDPVQLMEFCGNKVKQHLERLPEMYLGKPLLKDMSIGDFSEEQMGTLNELNDKFASHYASRKELLRRRMDVTLLALSYSKKVETQQEQIQEMISNLKTGLGFNDDLVMDPALVFKVKQHVVNIEKTNLRKDQKTTSFVKTVIIGDVPDRGGRLNDSRGRINMPKFRQRTVTKGGGGGGGRHKNRKGKKGKGNGGNNNNNNNNNNNSGNGNGNGKAKGKKRNRNKNKNKNRFKGGKGDKGANWNGKQNDQMETE